MVTQIYIFNVKISNLSKWSFSFFLIWIWSNYICFFWYYIDIKTQVNGNFTSSLVHFYFLGYLDEPWDHTVWYHSIPETNKIKNKNTLNNTNSCNNNFKYCFNKLHYDCKHLIVLIIVKVGSAWYNQRHVSRFQ